MRNECLWQGTHTPHSGPAGVQSLSDTISSYPFRVFQLPVQLLRKSVHRIWLLSGNNVWVSQQAFIEHLLCARRVQELEIPQDKADKKYLQFKYNVIRPQGTYLYSSRGRRECIYCIYHFSHCPREQTEPNRVLLNSNQRTQPLQEKHIICNNLKYYLYFVSFKAAVKSLEKAIFFSMTAKFLLGQREVRNELQDNQQLPKIPGTACPSLSCPGTGSASPSGTFARQDDEGFARQSPGPDLTPCRDRHQTHP